jgi:endonuclease/exonuclease/phosphatase family metal-dependent hydrolase
MGLLTASCLPVTRVDRVVFDARRSWDRFARKGALRVEVGGRLAVVNTHLQASYARDDPAGCRVRAHQLTQLAQLTQLTRPGYGALPVVVCGDFNGALDCIGLRSALDAPTLWITYNAAGRETTTWNRGRDSMPVDADRVLVGSGLRTANARTINMLPLTDHDAVLCRCDEYG